jgi:CRISPR-associated protein Csm1
MPQQTLNATCRVALAALLHDLGKFAERARIDCDPERLATWKQLDCPQWDGRDTSLPVGLAV